MKASPQIAEETAGRTRYPAGVLSMLAAAATGARGASTPLRQEPATEARNLFPAPHPEPRAARILRRPRPTPAQSPPLPVRLLSRRLPLAKERG